MTTVIHIHTCIRNGKLDLPPNARYIGRYVATYRLSASPFANPYVIGRHGTREEVIAQFEQAVRASPQTLEWIKKELRGKVLVCWCAPLACHGDVLARIADDGEPA